jgi:hypothetical protein
MDPRLRGDDGQCGDDELLIVRHPREGGGPSERFDNVLSAKQRISRIAPSSWTELHTELRSSMLTLFISAFLLGLIFNAAARPRRAARVRGTL